MTRKQGLAIGLIALQFIFSAYTINAIRHDDDHPPSEELNPSIFLRTLNTNEDCERQYYSSVATDGCDAVYQKEYFIYITVALLQLLTISGLTFYWITQYIKNRNKR